MGCKYYNPNTNKVFVLIYSMVKTDSEGWVDVNKFLPKDLDLVIVQLESGIKKKGWHYLKSWDGLTIKEDDKVLFWKRFHYEKLETKDLEDF